MGAGCGSLGEWVRGRLDVSPETARDLVATAKHLEELPDVEEAIAAGRDRVRPGRCGRQVRRAGRHVRHFERDGGFRHCRDPASGSSTAAYDQG